MAIGRMISRRTAKSRKIASTSDWAFRVWGMTLPFCDRDENLPFDEVELASECFPTMAAMSLVTPERVASGREELVKVGLWKVIDDGAGGKLIHVVKMRENQSNQFRPERETGKTYRDLRSDCGVIAELVRSDCGGDAALSAAPCGTTLNSKAEKEMERERESARARTSEEGAGNGTDYVSPANRNEATYLRPTVLDAMARALGEEEFIPSPVDGKALVRFAGPIGRCPDIDAFCRWGVAQLREKKPVREHWLADVLPLLNDYKPGRPTGMSYAEQREAEEAKARAAWIADARARGWS